MPPRPAPLTNRGDQVDQPPQSHEAGDLWFLAIAMVGAAACFVPMAVLVATRADTIGWLWAALTAFMALRLLTLLVRFAGHRWERTGAVL